MKTKKSVFLLLTIILSAFTSESIAQKVQNDSNSPLHLMRPAYKYNYGVPSAANVKKTIDRVKDYLVSNTFAELDKSGTKLRQGDFRLTSYEWGVTYSAMLRATELTGDPSYRNYATECMSFLAKQAPRFRSWLQEGKKIDPLMKKVVAPAALDDAGAICSAMIKSKMPELQSQIETYYDYIANHQYRYSDGQFARMRPVANTVWLDDMFMGIPALAFHGDIKEAQRQFKLFHEKMWVPEARLYRHGWTPAQYHPAFFWGRANGWALLTACELLDVADSPEIKQQFIEHLSGLLPLQDYDGAWHQLLNNPQTYLETSCTAIYCYCLAHAINQGWIEAEPYIGQTLLAWNYVNAHINDKGQVEGTCVGTGLAFDPAFYAYRPISPYAAHGYGPVIWAGAEIYKLVSTHCIKLNDSAVHYYPTDPETNEPIFDVKP